MGELAGKRIEPASARGQRRLRALSLLADLLGTLGEQVLFEPEGGECLLGLERLAAVVLEQLAVAADVGVDARKLVVGRHAGLANALGLTAQLVELAVERLEARIGLAALRRECLELAGARGGAGLGMVKLLAQLRETGDEVLALLLEKEQTGIEALENRLHPAALLGEVADEQPLLLEQRLELLELALLLGEAVARQVDVGVRFLLALCELVPRRLEAAQVIDGEREVEVAQLADEAGVLLGLRRLALERSKLTVDLARDVPSALEVRVHGAELAQRALLALLVLEHPGGLFDERAPLFRARVQDLVEPSLADDRVSVASQARIAEEVLDVHEPRRRVVDEVLGFAVAVHAARDGDLGELERQRAVGVVEHEVDLGDADRLSGRRPGEDDVLHRLPAQLLGGLLAQNPQDRIGDVGLARAVGADDDRHARLELHHALVRKGLEPLECERFEVHGPPRKRQVAEAKTERGNASESVSQGPAESAAYRALRMRFRTGFWRASSAAVAAIASASRLVRPVPVPSRAPSTSTATVKVRSCGGPSSESVS